MICNNDNRLISPKVIWARYSDFGQTGRSYWGINTAFLWILASMKTAYLKSKDSTYTLTGFVKTVNKVKPPLLSNCDLNNELQFIDLKKWRLTPLYKISTWETEQQWTSYKSTNVKMEFKYEVPNNKLCLVWLPSLSSMNIITII